MYFSSVAIGVVTGGRGAGVGGEGGGVEEMAKRGLSVVSLKPL